MYNFAEFAAETNSELFAMRCFEETLTLANCELDQLEDEPWDFADTE